MRQRLFLSSLFLGLTLYLGYGVQRAQFGPFIGAYGLFFGLYAFVVFQKNNTAEDLRWYAMLGIVLRAALLFSLPNLSDDFYRFVWDGRLLAQGINPFAHPPRYFMDHASGVPGLTPELFARLNSPDYHSVYPPVCQLVFAAASWLFPQSLLGAVVTIKLFLLACEVGTMWLLGRGAPLYALNPLVILEIVGNCHFEGAMICFLLAGLAALRAGRWVTGAGWWALATASKLLPPLFLPIVWRWLGWRQGLLFVVIFGGFAALCFAPLLQMEMLANIGDSLRLYFRQFEFNASVYYLAKYSASFFTEKETGRMIGPVLGALTAVAVLGLAFCKIRRGGSWADFQSALCLASSVYLFNATTMHPWYVTVPLALSVGTRWRFPVLWSGLAALSYSHYAGGGFRENYTLIAVEYGLVWGWLGLESLERFRRV